MKTLQTLPVAGIALFVFTVSPAQAKPPARMVSKALHYSLEVPDGWKHSASGNKTVDIFVGPADKGFAPNVNVIIQPSPTPALPDSKVFFDGLRKQYGTRGTLIETKKTTFGGRPAYATRARIRGAASVTVENQQIFCVYQNSFYIVTFSETAAQSKKYNPIGDKILASFRFEK